MTAMLEYLASAAPLDLLLLKATLLLAAAWTLHTALGRANPRWRVWLWRTAVVGLASAALWAGGLPGWNWRISAAPALQAVIADPASSVTQRDRPADSAISGGAATPQTAAASLIDDAQSSTHARAATVHRILPPAPTASPSPSITIKHADWRLWLSSAWLAVALLLAARLFLQHRAIAQMIGRSTPVSSPLRHTAADVAAGLGVRHPFDVRESAEIDSPLLAGFARPVVVLPLHLARDADSADLRMMLGHELAHVAGRDLWWTLALRAAAILLWFHPLMWRAGRAHRLACEMIADGLAAGDEGRCEYARLLARLGLIAQRGRPWEAGVAMLATAEITRRLQRLNRPLAVARLPGWSRSAWVLAMAAFIGGVAALRFSRADGPTAEASARSVESRSEADAAPERTSAALLYVESLRQARDEVEARAKELNLQIPRRMAVLRGLEYLATIQRDDGSFAPLADGEPRVGLTALCALAMWRSGAAGDERRAPRLNRAVDYILSAQQESGYFAGSHPTMYDHAFATWLIAELHGGGRFQDRLREPLQRAVALIQSTQHADGAWGYNPEPESPWGDLSQTACQLRALAAVRECGIEVADETCRRGIAYLSSCQARTGAFCYQSDAGPGTFSCTAAALSAMRALAAGDQAVLDKGTTALSQYLDQSIDIEAAWRLYGYFFASEALRAAGDGRRPDWFAPVCERLVNEQKQDGRWIDLHNPVGHGFTTALAVLILFSADPPAADPPAGGADGGAAADANPPPAVPMLTATVRVTDQEGRPIAGAVVKPFGLRTKREPASHYSWNPTTYGAQPTATTDADGIARVACPKYVYEEMETGQVTWLVDHPQYVVFWEDRSVDNNPAEVVLDPGVIIAVRAIDDTTDRPVEAPFALLSGPSFGNEWTLGGDGTLVSRAVARNRRMLRVVHVPDDRREPVLFSDLIDLQQHAGRTLDLTVRLKPGVHVTGRLDDVVPRPVVGGVVTALVISLPQSPADEADYAARWTWSEAATVSENGDFDLGWLPQGELLQVIALCDGFVSRDPDQPEIDAVIARRHFPMPDVTVRANRTWPQIAWLDGPQLELSVRMEPTAVCQVTLRSPDNAPIAGARVSFWPNQAWYEGGSQITGDGSSLSQTLRSSRKADPAAQPAHTPRQGGQRYQAMTDERGTATIRNLPARGSEHFDVDHPDWEAPPNPGQPEFRYLSVDLVAGQTAEITVPLQPRGTQVIGRAN